MASKRYIKENDAGGWEVVKEGHRRATAQADTRAKAIARARDLTRQEGGGEIRVVNRTGKVVSSDTVRRRRSTTAQSR